MQKNICKEPLEKILHWAVKGCYWAVILPPAKYKFEKVPLQQVNRNVFTAINSEI